MSKRSRAERRARQRATRAAQEAKEIVADLERRAGLDAEAAHGLVVDPHAAAPGGVLNAGPRPLVGGPRVALPPIFTARKT